jgi:hypothetical protein
MAHIGLVLAFGTGTSWTSETLTKITPADTELALE